MPVCLCVCVCVCACLRVHIQLKNKAFKNTCARQRCNNCMEQNVTYDMQQQRHASSVQGSAEPPAVHPTMCAQREEQVFFQCATNAGSSTLRLCVHRRQHSSTAAQQHLLAEAGKQLPGVHSKPLGPMSVRHRSRSPDSSTAKASSKQQAASLSQRPSLIPWACVAPGSPRIERSIPTGPAKSAGVPPQCIRVVDATSWMPWLGPVRRKVIPAMS